MARRIGSTHDRRRARAVARIAEEYARCHPGERFEDLVRRARFSREDRGLLRDWMDRAAHLETSSTTNAFSL